ncbi:MAG: substrate-binding and VWA domain-containing protein [Dermatophilaceae bacterium]
MAKGRHARPQPARRVRWLGIGLAGLVVLGGTSVMLAVQAAIGDDDQTTCVGEMTPLVVASSADKAGLLAQMAADFNTRNPTSRGPCVEVEVLTKSSGTAQIALARGWTADDGPRPDVWSPTGSVWLPLLEQRLKAAKRPSLIADPSAVTSVAQSPMVIAMPRPMAEALGWPSEEIGWSELLNLARSRTGWGAYGHPEWGSFVLGKTNPNFSHAGLEGTIAAYYAAVGRTSKLTVADVGLATTREFVAGVEQTIQRYGDTTGSFASDWQKADAEGRAMEYVSALVTEENLVVSYNQGNPTGDPAKAGDLPQPRIPLVSIYPKEGTFIADHPYATLDADWVTPEKRAAAEKFYAYLVSDEVQRIWQENHFRNIRGELAPALGPEKGVLPTQPKAELQPPAAEVTNAVLASWAQLRKVANVLTLVDVSGSMRDPVAGSETTKLAAASDAIADSLKLFTDNDEVGLWTFSDAARGPDYTQRVPIGPMGGKVGSGDRRSALSAAAMTLEPQGDTALYNSLAAAYQTVASRYRDNRINAVVLLTDGKNETSGGLSLDALLAQVQRTYPSKPVHIITIGYGPDADNETLAKIAQASEGASYKAATTADIAKVYSQALSNF